MLGLLQYMAFKCRSGVLLRPRRSFFAASALVLQLLGPAAFASAEEGLALPEGTILLIHPTSREQSGDSKRFFTFGLKSPAVNYRDVIPLLPEVHTGPRRYLGLFQGPKGRYFLITSSSEMGREIVSLESGHGTFKNLFAVPNYPNVVDVGQPRKLLWWIDEGKPYLRWIGLEGKVANPEVVTESINIHSWFNKDVYGEARYLEATPDGVLVVTDKYLVDFQIRAGAATLRGKYDLSALAKALYEKEIRVTGVWSHGNKGWIRVELAPYTSTLVPFELGSADEIRFNVHNRPSENGDRVRVVDVDKEGNLLFVQSARATNDRPDAKNLVRRLYSGGGTQLMTEIDLEALNGKLGLRPWINRIIKQSLNPDYFIFKKVLAVGRKLIGSTDFSDKGDDGILSQFSAEMIVDYPRSKFYPTGRRLGLSDEEAIRLSGLEMLERLRAKVHYKPMDAALSADELFYVVFEALVKFRQKFPNAGHQQYISIKGDESEAELTWQEYLDGLVVDKRELVDVVNSSHRLKAIFAKFFSVKLERKWGLKFIKGRLFSLRPHAVTIRIEEFAKSLAPTTCEDLLADQRPKGTVVPFKRKSDPDSN